MRPISRIQPGIPAQNMKTYQIVSPIATHWRSATCEEVQCQGYLHGWRSLIDERTALGQGQAAYIRRQSGRQFSEEKDPTGVTVFIFGAGQACFKQSEHRLRNGRPDIFAVKGGDWRGNPLGVRPLIHQRPEYWVEDFAQHQDSIIQIQKRG